MAQRWRSKGLFNSWRKLLKKAGKENNDFFHILATNDDAFREAEPYRELKEGNTREMINV